MRNRLRGKTKSEVAKLLSKLGDDAVKQLWWDWQVVHARDNQLEPLGDWIVWLILAGRGWGKTRTGAEWVRQRVDEGCGRIALVGATAADTRDVMVEGVSGLLSVCPPWNRPIYEPSKRRCTWPNGAIATLYSADEPDRLRGPQHDAAWADELAAWRYADAWDQLRFGLRLGTKPRVVVTTTPRPTKLVKDLVKENTTHVTKGNTYENQNNLAQDFVDLVVKRYEGTRLGRQELYAEILDDVPGALWTRDLLDELRVSVHPPLRRIVVAIDPAVTSAITSNETGLIVGGISQTRHGYILHDGSGRMPANKWAQAAVDLMREHNGDRIVAEVNNGGELVEATIRTIDKNVSYKAVHASRGKVSRAEPVSALYEQKKVHHVGMFGQLEDQMCTYTPLDFDGSPDRVDALVWCLTDLMLGVQSVSNGMSLAGGERKAPHVID